MSQPDARRDLLGGTRSLLNRPSDEARSAVAGMIGGATRREMLQVPLLSIQVDEQVRREFPSEAHRALVENIRAQGGVIEPVIVNRRSGENRYLLVAGERRVRACQALVREYEASGDAELADRYSFVPAIVYDDLSPEQVREMQLSENLLRQDLTELEETLALVDLLASRLGVEAGEVPGLLERLEKESRGERKVSEESAGRLGVVEETFGSFSSVGWRTFVKKRLHLLRMPSDMVAAVRAGRVSSAQAELIRRLPDARMRENMVDRVERGMKLEELAQAVRDVTTKPVAAHPAEVQVAIRVKKRLTPKRLLSLPSDSRRRVQELLEEVNRLMGEEGGEGRG